MPTSMFIQTMMSKKVPMTKKPQVKYPPNGPLDIPSMLNSPSIKIHICKKALKAWLLVTFLIIGFSASWSRKLRTLEKAAITISIKNKKTLVSEKVYEIKVMKYAVLLKRRSQYSDLNHIKKQLIEDRTLTILMEKILVSNKNFVIKIPMTSEFNELLTKFSMFHTSLKYKYPSCFIFCSSTQ